MLLGGQVSRSRNRPVNPNCPEHTFMTYHVGKQGNMYVKTVRFEISGTYVATKSKLKSAKMLLLNYLDWIGNICFDPGQVKITVRCIDTPSDLN